MGIKVCRRMSDGVILVYNSVIAARKDIEVIEDYTPPGQEPAPAPAPKRRRRRKATPAVEELTNGVETE